MIKQITLIAVLLVLGQWLYAQREVRVRLFADPDMQQFIDAAEVRADNVGFQPKRLGKGLYKLTFPGLADGQEVVLSVLKDGYAVVNPHVLRFNAPGNNNMIIDVVLCTSARLNDCRVDYYAINIEKLLQQRLRKINRDMGLNSDDSEKRKSAEEVSALLQDKNQIRSRARELARLDREQASERIVLALDAFASGNLDRAQQYISSARLLSRVDQFVKTETDQQKEKTKLVSDLKIAAIIAQYALKIDTAVFYLRQAYLVDKEDLSIGASIIALGVLNDNSLTHLDELLPAIEKVVPRTETDRANQLYCMIVGRIGTPAAKPLIDSLYRFCNNATTIAMADLAGFYLGLSNLDLTLNQSPVLYQSAIPKAAGIIATIPDTDIRLDKMISLFRLYLITNDLDRAESLLKQYEKLFVGQKNNDKYDLYLYNYAFFVSDFASVARKNKGNNNPAVRILKETYTYCIDNQVFFNQSVGDKPGYVIILGLLLKLEAIDFPDKERYFLARRKDFDQPAVKQNEDYFFVKSVLYRLIAEVYDNNIGQSKKMAFLDTAFTNLKRSLKLNYTYAAYYPIMLYSLMEEMEEDEIEKIYAKEKRFIATISNKDTKTLLNGYLGLCYKDESDVLDCDETPTICDVFLESIYEGYLLALRKKINEGFETIDADELSEGFEVVVEDWIDLKANVKARVAAENFYRMSKEALDRSFTQDNLVLHYKLALTTLFDVYINTGRADRPVYILDSLFTHYASYMQSSSSKRFIIPFMLDVLFPKILYKYENRILAYPAHPEDTLYVKQMITLFEETFRKNAPYFDTAGLNIGLRSVPYFKLMYDTLRLKVEERVLKTKKAGALYTPGQPLRAGRSMAVSYFLRANRLSVKLFKNTTRSFFSCRVRCRGLRSSGSVLMLPVTHLAGSS
jgi:hypothetical protein